MVVALLAARGAGTGDDIGGGGSDMGCGSNDASAADTTVDDVDSGGLVCLALGQCWRLASAPAINALVVPYFASSVADLEELDIVLPLAAVHPLALAIPSHGASPMLARSRSMPGPVSSNHPSMDAVGSAVESGGGGGNGGGDGRITDRVAGDVRAAMLAVGPTPAEAVALAAVAVGVTRLGPAGVAAAAALEEELLAFAHDSRLAR